MSSIIGSRFNFDEGRFDEIPVGEDTYEERTYVLKQKSDAARSNVL